MFMKSANFTTLEKKDPTYTFRWPFGCIAISLINQQLTLYNALFEYLIKGFHKTKTKEWSVSNHLEMFMEICLRLNVPLK